MKKIISVVCLLILVCQFSGCAVVMALKQPSKKNLSVLNQGTARENVITYLGAPINSEKENDKRVDIYEFTQGYSGATKASRALFHALADAFTLFIWEVIGTPAEAIFNGEKKTLKVIYDSEDRLDDFMYLHQE